MQRNAFTHRENIEELPRGAANEIVVAGQPGGERAADRQRYAIARPGAQPIAILGEGEQRFQPMIAVGPPLPDMEGEVDLGPGGFMEQTQGRDPSASRPEASLRAMRAASFSSAWTSAACQAKRAS